MRKIFLIFAVFVFAYTLSFAQEKKVIDVNIDEAVKMINENKGNPDFIILDVRTTEEFAGGFIDGAQNIDIKSPDFEMMIDKLDKTRTYLVYCRKGGRSAKAAELMNQKGFEKVYNLLGGITKWTEEKKEIKTN
jgi:rhodanese-related sulfurtransferase